MTLEQIKSLRREAAARKRRLILHSDNRPFDNTIFRYAPETHVTSCTFSMIHQFGFARYYKSRFAKNLPGHLELDEKGRDSFQLYLDFCRKNNLEAFWAMRINDIHDMKETPQAIASRTSNPFKRNPENLLGTKDNPPPFANAWTGVDYARDEIRRFVVDVVEEACRRGVDGILLDFIRHHGLFKTVAWGQPVKNEEIGMMTDLFRTIRRKMDEVGAETGKPILLAARLPDSIGFCRGMGVDLQTWMEEGLIDIWLAAGNFRLREWEDTVRDGHQYGVQVWASLDTLLGRQCSLRDENVCNSPEMFRARALNAWNAGVDALYLFNFIHNIQLDTSIYNMDKRHLILLNQLGDPEKLEHKDKVYVGEGRCLDLGSPWNSAYLAFKGSGEFIERPVAFSPEKPEDLGPGQGTGLSLRIGDDVEAADPNGHTPEVSLKLATSVLKNTGELSVTLNSSGLTNGKLDGDYLSFSVTPDLVKKGPNSIAIKRADTAQGIITLREIQLFVRYE